MSCTSLPLSVSVPLASCPVRVRSSLIGLPSLVTLPARRTLLASRSAIRASASTSVAFFFSRPLSATDFLPLPEVTTSTTATIAAMTTTAPPASRSGSFDFFAAGGGPKPPPVDGCDHAGPPPPVPPQLGPAGPPGPPCPDGPPWLPTHVGAGAPLAGSSPGSHSAGGSHGYAWGSVGPAFFTNVVLPESGMRS